MVDCENVVCIRIVRLGVSVIMVYRPPSDDNHISQFILSFSVDREVILIVDINLPSIN